MWIKSFAILLGLFCSPLVLSISGQTPSISTVDWEFRQIVKSIVDHENRVRSLIEQMEVRINTSITDLTPNAKAKNLITALNSLRNVVVVLKTVDNYGSNASAITCDEVAARVASIQFDIAKCNKVNLDIAVNLTTFLKEYAKVQIEYTLASMYLIPSQISSVNIVVTSENLLLDEYNQFIVAVVLAIVKYVRIFIDFLFCKTTYCYCPVQLSGSSSSALAIADTTVIELQKGIDAHEAKIRTMSNDIVNKIAAVNPELKLNPLLIPLTVVLDTISILFKGFSTLTSTDVINGTANCDDAIKKVAFLKYKYEKYLFVLIEAEKNASFAYFHHNNLKTFLELSSKNLTPAQKRSVEAIITAILNLCDEFRLYLIDLVLATIKLFLLSWDAKVATMASCNCTALNGTSEYIG